MILHSNLMTNITLLDPVISNFKQRFSQTGRLYAVCFVLANRLCRNFYNGPQ